MFIKLFNFWLSVCRFDIWIINWFFGVLGYFVIGYFEEFEVVMVIGKEVWFVYVRFGFLILVGEIYLRG